MKEIALTQGYAAIVDDADYERLMQWTWRYKSGYAVRGRNTWLMHHDIIGRPAHGMYVDHINRNPLDNRRSNLRMATASQNQINSGPKRDGYKGITFHKGARRWQASIQVNGKQIYLGLHDTPKQAAIAYNAAASEYFGEYAFLNEVPS